MSINAARILAVLTSITGFLLIAGAAGLNDCSSCSENELLIRALLGTLMFASGYYWRRVLTYVKLERDRKRLRYKAFKECCKKMSA